MKRLLTGFCALALGAGLLTACTESGSDRVGERPGERTPSASPPTTTTPGGSGTSTGSGTTTPGGTSTTPGGSTSSPSGTGTK
jgi:hypothetical protein